MTAFRSEGEVEEWCLGRDRKVGAVFSPQILWRLARVWYDDRLEPDWRRRTADERQALLRDVGLVGPFWRIEPP